MNVLRPVAGNSASQVASEVPATATPRDGQPTVYGMPPGVPRLSDHEQQEARQAAEQFHLGSDNTRRFALLQRFAYNLNRSPQNAHAQRRQSLEIRYEQIAELVQKMVKTSESLHDTLDRFGQAETNHASAVQQVRGQSNWLTRLVPDALLNKQLAARAQDVRRLEQTAQGLSSQLDRLGREADKVLFSATSVRWLQRPVPPPPPDSVLKHVPFF